MRASEVPTLFVPVNGDSSQIPVRNRSRVGRRPGRQDGSVRAHRVSHPVRISSGNFLARRESNVNRRARPQKARSVSNRPAKPWDPPAHAGDHGVRSRGIWPARSFTAAVGPNWHGFAERLPRPCACRLSRPRASSDSPTDRQSVQVGKFVGKSFGLNEIICFVSVSYKLTSALGRASAESGRRGRYRALPEPLLPGLPANGRPDRPIRRIRSWRRRFTPPSTREAVQK